MGALVVAFVLNVASEQVSFSTIIERVPPLRFVDQLGRRPGVRDEGHQP